MVEVRCEHCPRRAPAFSGQPAQDSRGTDHAPQGVFDMFVEMQGDVPWYLCVRCWLDGRYPRGEPQRVVEVPSQA